MIVCKFGGTSVAGLESSLLIKKIVNSNPNRKIVVVSALGKSDDYRYKVTDKLFELYGNYSNGEDYSNCINDVFTRYEKMSEYLGVKINWNVQKQQLIRDLLEKRVTRAYVVSRGEYYSALLYSKYLGGQFLDATDYIYFNKNGKLNINRTIKMLKTLDKEKLYVIGGFYGAFANKEVCVFDRGGSDITGAVMARGLNAEIYENYTDVCGVYDKNPNVFVGAKNLPILSYKTTIQMAEAGNEVIHKDALLILKNTQTILLIKDTSNYTKLGTVVLDNGVVSDDLYICTMKTVCLLTKNVTNELLTRIGHWGNIKNIYTTKNCYYVMVNNCVKSPNYLRECCGNKVEYVYVIKLFSNIKISKNNLKLAKKIAKMVKNYAFFCKFCAIDNNVTIICDGKYYGVVLKIINRCLQKK